MDTSDDHAVNLPDYMSDSRTVSPSQLAQHLTTLGYGRYADAHEEKFIHIEEGQITYVTERDIRRALCAEAEHNDVSYNTIDVLMQTHSLTPALARVPLKVDGTMNGRGEHLPLLRDDSTTVRLPFRNGIVTITADDMRLVPYAKQDAVVWTTHVLPHEIDIETAQPTGAFETFCERAFYRPTGVGAKDWTHDFAMTEDAAKQYRAFKGTLGYLSHAYRDPANPRAVLYVDMESDSSRAEGGNGKSLSLQVLKHLRRVVMQDGKRYGASKEGARFQFSNITDTTNLVVIDDIQKTFNFETLFSMLTGDLEMERKGKDKVVIPADRVPKVAITTNYIVPPTGTSFERRLYVVEFGSYWTNCHQHQEQVSDPKHLGVRLFERGFSEQQWQQTFQYLFGCVQLYLRDGVQPASLDVYRRKALRRELGADFVDWAFEYFEDYERLKIEPNTGQTLRELYERMTAQAPDARCAPTQFASYLMRIGAVCGYEYNPHKADKGNTPTARRWRVTQPFGNLEDSVLFKRR